MLIWTGAIAQMQGGRLGPELLTAIVGVLGEMELRGIRLPDGLMAAMNHAAIAAFNPLAPEVRLRMLNDLASKVESAMPAGRGLRKEKLELRRL